MSTSQQNGGRRKIPSVKITAVVGLVLLVLGLLWLRLSPQEGTGAVQPSRAQEEVSLREENRVPHLAVSGSMVSPTIIQWQDPTIDQGEPEIIDWESVETTDLLEIELDAPDQHVIRGVIAHFFPNVTGREQKPLPGVEPIILATGIGAEQDFALNRQADGARIPLPRGVKYASVNVYHNYSDEKLRSTEDDLITTYFLKLV